METPNSYATVERMIHRGDFMLSDLERLLETLQKQERITVLEHEALLELAWHTSIRNVPRT